VVRPLLDEELRSANLCSLPGTASFRRRYRYFVAERENYGHAYLSPPSSPVFGCPSGEMTLADADFLVTLLVTLPTRTSANRRKILKTDEEEGKR
jgi:hypothetical protein